jgi:phage gp46-like protein
MTDLALQFDDGKDRADLVLEQGDLRLDQGLATAAIASLFTDGLAPVDPAVPVLDQDRRGWWPDAITGDPWGSQLWKLDRGKAITPTLRQAERSALDALAWMKDEGIASAIGAHAILVDGDALELEVTIQRGTARRWGDLWQSTASLSIPGQDITVGLDFA